MERHGNKLKILFLCVNNAARSQMAEGLMRKLYGDRFDVYSAGTKATAVNPYAIKIMAEAGVDISGQRSKSIEEYLDTDMDYVVTLCDDAQGACPVFPNAGQLLNHRFDDPSRFSGNEGQMLRVFRRVRNEIEAWLQETFSGVQTQK